MKLQVFTRKDSFTFHRYCIRCHAPFPKGVEQCPLCDAHVDKDKYFICSDLKVEMQRIYKGRIIVKLHSFCDSNKCIAVAGSWDQLGYHMAPPKNNAEDSEDMYDGNKYLDLKEKGWFESPGDVGLLLSTDGGALFKSSGVEAWPVWGVISNLPPHIRYCLGLVVECCNESVHSGNITHIDIKLRTCYC
jgi:hypothetical protein